MNLIDVLDGGMLTTVQDLGRYGFQRYGVPVSGALDALALRAANLLVGNDEGDAGLEMTLIGPRLRFLAPGTVALTGADLGARLDGAPVAMWESVQVREGAVLSFAGPRAGMRAYLAVAGGLDVPVVLGSRSTYVRSRLGGVEGRGLKAGDRLAIPGDRPIIDAAVRQVPADRVPAAGGAATLRIIPGPQSDRFTNAGLQTFLTSDYRVTPQSDRMGYRLEGPKIEHLAGPDIVSDGTPPGAVQVAGDGMPIVLLADRGTAGGYTKIATVISVDTRLLAQSAPGDIVRFTPVTMKAAHEALRQEESFLQALRVIPRESGTRRKRAAAAAAVVAMRLGLV